jgi:hypothetical protein
MPGSFRYFGQRVAVKEIFTQMRDAMDLAEVARETEYLWRLQSPFITQFYGITLSKEKHLLIVQERCVCSLKRAYHEPFVCASAYDPLCASLLVFSPVA